MPCSPMPPDSRMRSPGAHVARRQARPRVAPADARRCTCTSRRRGRARRPSCRRSTISTPAVRRRARDRFDLGAQLIGGKSLLEHQRQAQRERTGARDGEIVDGAVDGQLADRAARKAQRPDDVGVGRERELHAVDAEHPGVGHLGQRARVVEDRHQQPFDQGLGRLAAGAVGHRDPLVAELRALAARGLDDPEDPLLALCEIVAGSAITPPPARARSGRSCSRRRRPPRRRPCTCRSGARACTRCRRPCTPTA